MKISTTHSCLENYTRYYSTSHRHLVNVRNTYPLVPLDYGLVACLNPVYHMKADMELNNIALNNRKATISNEPYNYF